jgi:hypothetical protein
MTEQEMQLQIAIEQGKVNTLRQEVAGMNKEREYWQHYRTQAAIAAMQGQLANQVLTDNMIESVENVADFPKVVANESVRIADALIAELQKKQD